MGVTIITMLTIQKCLYCGNEYKTNAKKPGYCKNCRSLTKPCPICSKEIFIGKVTCSYTCSSKYRLERFGNPWSRPDVARKCQETRSKHYEPIKKANELKRSEDRKVWEEGREQRKQLGIQKRAESLKLSGKKVGMGNLEAKKRIMQTSLERNGGMGLASEKTRKKVQQTLQEKYGVTNVFQREDVKNKIRQTMLSRYGVSSGLSTGPLRDKCLDIIKQKYGVNNAWLIHSESQAISKVNRDFGERFIKLGYSVQYEYNIENFSYDLLIAGKIILEVNPTVTHNEDVSFQYLRKYTTENNPVDHKHLERYFTALNENKIPIFFFDWMSKETVIDYIDFLLRDSRQNNIEFNDVFDFTISEPGKIELFLKEVNYKDFSFLNLQDAFNRFALNKQEIFIKIDRSSGLSEVFKRLGFKLTDSFLPEVHYCKLDGKICKDPTESAELQEAYKQQGLVRVLDCGKEIYTWRRA